jgi:uncharacterized protein (DUF2147 family)
VELRGFIEHNGLPFDRTDVCGTKASTERLTCYRGSILWDFDRKANGEYSLDVPPFCLLPTLVLRRCATFGTLESGTIPLNAKKMIGPLGAVCAILIAIMSAARADDPTTATPTAAPTGEWLVADKVARIKIANCDGELWGVVSWEMQPGTDSKNPDPNLRSRPTLGMPILLGMTQSKVNQWDGKIYNSQDGNTYSANIKLENPDTLRVQGCFLGILCGGENWSRVDPADIPAPAPARTVPPPKKSRTAAAVQPPPTDSDVCLGIVSPAGLTHERGLK